MVLKLGEPLFVRSVSAGAAEGAGTLGGGVGEDETLIVGGAITTAGGVTSTEGGGTLTVGVATLIVGETLAGRYRIYSYKSLVGYCPIIVLFLSDFMSDVTNKFKLPCKGADAGFESKPARTLWIVTLC